MSRLDLMRLPAVRLLVRSRFPQLAVTALALGGFLLVILAGLLGTPVGSRNFATISVWIAWWALLLLVAVPALGRTWCGVCPIPIPGEWLQRGRVLGPGARTFGLARRWPRALKGMWLQNAAFLLLALFSAVILTQPLVTALLLAGLLVVATAMSLVFERRSFCRYVCPVGGFIGLYSQTAPIEIRVKDKQLCSRCAEKSCYNGSRAGYGCPWLVYPRALLKNTYCGFCFECLRSCPNDNLALNVRPLGADLRIPNGRSMDEAYKAFIMLGTALVYSAVLLGPWGKLKTAAYAVGSIDWLLYAGAFLVLVLGLLPGMFFFTVFAAGRLTKTRVPLKRRFIHCSYSLVPLGLGAWIAFSLAFVFANGSYIWHVLADPMGWGWNLTGAAGAVWTPYATGVVPTLQVLVLLAALCWSSFLAHDTGREIVTDSGRPWHSIAVTGFCVIVSVGLMGLLIR